MQLTAFAALGSLTIGVSYSPKAVAQEPWGIVTPNGTVLATAATHEIAAGKLNRQKAAFGVRAAVRYLGVGDGNA